MLGTALVILFASPGTLAGRLLSSRILVGIGLISYSAYLWHWPLFAFARIYVGSRSHTLFAELSVLSLGLAFVSWRYVERPFRDRKVFQRSQIFRFATAGAVLLVAVGWVGLNGIPSRFAGDEDLFVSHEERTQYVLERYNKLEATNHFDSKNKLHVLLLGDSQSQDFLNMMAEAGLLPDSEIRARYIPFACQIYLGEENWLDFVTEGDRSNCERIYNKDYYPSLQPLIESADVIIFAPRWKEWAVRRLPETIKNLHIPDSTRVLVIGKKKFWTIKIRDYLGLSRQEKSALRSHVHTDFLSINELVRKGTKTMPPNVEFVDLYELICGAGSQTCSVFSPDGKLLSYDGDHLTQAGATYVGGLLKEHHVFKAIEGRTPD